MNQVRDLLAWGREVLQSNVQYPARDACLLLAFVLGETAEYPYLHPEAPVDENRTLSYRQLVTRRASGEPVAYLRGYKEFMGIEFKVDNRVLIPRPETEVLVEAALEILKGPAIRELWENPVVADVGCGSGAIGLSLASLAGCRVILADICPNALELAKENAGLLGVSDKTEYLQGDLMEPLFRQGYAESLSMVVSNPPYISRKCLESLPETVRCYEPLLALDGGPEGLDCIAKLIKDASRALLPGGYLLVEIDPDQSASCARMVREQARWDRFEILRDYASFERVLVCRAGGASPGVEI